MRPIGSRAARTLIVDCRLPVGAQQKGSVGAIERRQLAAGALPPTLGLRFRSLQSSRRQIGLNWRSHSRGRPKIVWAAQKLFKTSSANKCHQIEWAKWIQSGPKSNQRPRPAFNFGPHSSSALWPPSAGLRPRREDESGRRFRCQNDEQKRAARADQSS